MNISARKDSIAASFSAVAESYDAWAEPQRRMARRLVELLPDRLPPGSVVDLCCGTGLLTELLRGRYPAASLLGVDIAPGMIGVCRRRWPDDPSLAFEVSDAETFAGGESYALIACNCGLQWFRSPAEAIARLAKALAAQGLLAVSVPVKGSLPELRESYQAVTGDAFAGLEFLPAAGYSQAIEAAGLRCGVARDETVRTYYASAWDALRSFKYTGTTFRHHEGYSPLSVPAMRRLAGYYGKEFAGADGRVPVTYRMLYVIAEAAE